MNRETQVIIVGSGLAGLAAALKIAPFAQVTLITKSNLEDANTAMAQGGIAAVSEPQDSVESHINDTLIAGAGLCREEVVRQLVHQAADRIEDLAKWGVRFDRSTNGNGYDLTREGGHHARRVLHYSDQTGAEIESQLVKRVLENPHIEILSNHHVIDLITSHSRHELTPSTTRCLGAYVLNQETGRVEAIFSQATILATGGAGKVYLYTSNWAGATGDGIALAYRAGARVANLEFMQFHPTCLYHPQARNFLISEALRGEGGILRDRHGNAFMAKYHAMESLAPRDVVARSIDAEMKKSGDPCVYLDMTHLPAHFLEQRFPAIHAKCLEHGIDLRREPIPVVPAAHYLCGGIVADVNGKTDVQSLFAVGETSCTGFHGANRLASNSLLECIAMAHNCAGQIKVGLEHWPLIAIPAKWNKEDKPDADELVVVSHSWDEIRRLMWNYVGIVRSNRRLRSAQRRLAAILREVQDYEKSFKTHPDIIELRNLALVAALTVECALRRQESRGIHFSLDYPEPQALAQDSVLSATDGLGLF